MGWLDPCLGHIVDFQPPALVRRRLNPRLGIGQHGVEHAGSDPGHRLVVHILDQLQGGLTAMEGMVGHMIVRLLAAAAAAYFLGCFNGALEMEHAGEHVPQQAEQAGQILAQRFPAEGRPRQPDDTPKG